MKYWGIFVSIIFVLIISGCEQKKEDSIVFNLPTEWNKSNIFCTVVKEKSGENVFEKSFSIETYFKNEPVEIPVGYFNSSKIVFVGVYNKENYMESKELDRYLITGGKKITKPSNIAFVDRYGNKFDQTKNVQGVLIYF